MFQDGVYRIHPQCALETTTYAHSPVCGWHVGEVIILLGLGEHMVNGTITFRMGSLAGVTVSPVLPERGRDDLPPPSGS